jgi:glycosyltransferase involved in cell wall biosynthesis
LRVLFVSIDDFRGPTSKQLHHFASELARRGHECLLLLNGDPRSFDELGRTRTERVQLARYSFVGPWLSPRTLRTVRSFRPDIVHCYEPRVASFAAASQSARAAGAPLCVHFADDDVTLFREAGSTRVRRAARPFLRAGARLYPPLWPLWDPRLDGRLAAEAAAFDALTPALAELVERRLGLPCCVILPPVAAPPGLEPPNERLLRELDIGSAPYVLFTGAVYRAHEQDFALLIEAFGRVARTRPSLLLVHTGHVSPRIDVEALANATAAAGRVRHLGYLSSEQTVLRLLCGASVLVQPGAPTAFNRYRLPSKLPVYLLSGRPVVTFATGAGELLEDGVSALLTRTGDARELAEKIARVLNDPALADRIGAAGRARAAELFNAERNCGVVLDMYTDVLGLVRHATGSGREASRAPS